MLSEAYRDYKTYILYLKIVFLSELPDNDSRPSMPFPYAQLLNILLHFVAPRCFVLFEFQYCDHSLNGCPFCSLFLPCVMFSCSCMNCCMAKWELRKRELVTLRFLGQVCTVRRSLFSNHVNGKLCSVIVARPGHFLYHCSQFGIKSAFPHVFFCFFFFVFFCVTDEVLSNLIKTVSFQSHVSCFIFPWFHFPVVYFSFSTPFKRRFVLCRHAVHLSLNCPLHISSIDWRIFFETLTKCAAYRDQCAELINQFRPMKVKVILQGQTSHCSISWPLYNFQTDKIIS